MNLASIGEPVDQYVLTNGSGMRVKILTHGGIVQSVEVPDRSGATANVVLGFDEAQGYRDHPGPYFGALIGRYGNRIAAGRFTLDGAEHELPTNNGPNSLHGGAAGFDKHVWAATGTGADTLELRHVSPGSPGRRPG